VANCRSCKASIVWAITSTGRRMPFDAKPDSAGRFTLTPRGGDMVAEHVGTDHEGPLYRSHFATCLEADRFRRPR